MTKEQTNGSEVELKEIIDGDWELMELNPGRPYRTGMKEVHFIKLKVLISQEREKWVEEKVKELKGHIMSRIDFGCFSAKINNWDVDQREDYERRMEKEIINLLQK